MQAWRDLLVFVVIDGGLDANQAMLLSGATSVAPIIAAATARSLQGALARAILGGMVLPAAILLGIITKNFGIITKNPGVLVFAAIDIFIWAIFAGLVAHFVRRVAWWRKEKSVPDPSHRQAGPWRSAK